MKTLHPESVPVLRWVFQHNQHVVTCEIDASGDRAFDVCIVPHWNVSAAAIERFDAAYRAFERHAEVARRLREVGWARATSRSVLQPPTPRPWASSPPAHCSPDAR